MSRETNHCTRGATKKNMAGGKGIDITCGGKNGVARVTLRDTLLPGVPVFAASNHGRIPLLASRDPSEWEAIENKSDMGIEQFPFVYHYVSSFISPDIQSRDLFPCERSFYYQCLMHQEGPSLSEAKCEKYFLSLAKDRGRASPAVKDPGSTYGSKKPFLMSTFEWISQRHGGKSVRTANTVWQGVVENAL